jgi:hypothetical protein
MNAIKLFAAAALVLACALPSKADFTAVKLTASGGAEGGAATVPSSGTNLSVGWDFRPKQDIWVTALGFYDYSNMNFPFLGCCDGLSLQHTVRIWNSTGTTVLAANTVSNHDFAPIIDGFRYASITPVKLSANQTYVIGAQIFGGYDWYRFGVADSAVTKASQITLGDRRSASGADTFPLLENHTDRSYYGPNFQFTVPEPSTAALALAPVIVLTLHGSRRRPRTRV